MDFDEAEKQQPRPKLGKSQQQTEAEKLISELQNTVVTTASYRDLFARVDAMNTVLNTVIDQLLEDYDEKKKEYANASQLFQQRPDAINAEYVPVEVHRYLREIWLIQRNAFTYQGLQTEMWCILSQRFFKSLGTLVALDVEKRVLEQRKSEEEVKNKLFVEGIKTIIGNSEVAMRSIVDSAHKNQMDSIRVLANLNFSMYESQIELVNNLVDLPPETLARLKVSAQQNKQNITGKIKTPPKPDVKFTDAPEIEMPTGSESDEQKSENNDKKKQSDNVEEDEFALD